MICKSKKLIIIPTVKNKLKKGAKELKPIERKLSLRDSGPKGYAYGISMRDIPDSKICCISMILLRLVRDIDTRAYERG